MTNTGVVVLNYNDFGVTEILVQQLLKCSCINAVCVVDNYSTDESFSLLKRYESDKCHVIEADHNNGYAAGNNLGCRYLINNKYVDIVFIINPDVRIEEAELRKIITAFEENKEYMILSGVMHNQDRNVADRPFLYIPSFWENVLLCFYAYNRLYEKRHSYDIEQNKRVMQVDAVPGSLWAIRTDALKKINYLDEGTFLYFEEFSTAMRLKKYNEKWKIGIVTNAYYIHNHSVTIRKNIAELNVFKIYMNSKMYFEIKYRKISKIKIFILYLVEMISIFEKRMTVWMVSIFRK